MNEQKKAPETALSYSQRIGTDLKPKRAAPEKPQWSKTVGGIKYSVGVIGYLNLSEHQSGLNYCTLERDRINRKIVSMRQERKEYEKFLKQIKGLK